MCLFNVFLFLPLKKNASMTNLSYFDRKKQLVAVFNDTLQRIGSSKELQTAVNQSIASQQMN